MQPLPEAIVSKQGMIVIIRMGLVTTLKMCLLTGRLGDASLDRRVRSRTG
jgi:hypothetical protein